MKRISKQRVLKAVETLGELQLPKAGAALPGFFALKVAGVNTETWTGVSGTDFADTAEALYEVEGASPGRPYFDPVGGGGWKNSNWPRGATETAWKRDSTPLRKGKLEHRGEAENREWKLNNGYEPLLARYVNDGIPALDFAAWMFRSTSFGDETEPLDLVERMKSDLRLNSEEFETLFDSSPSPSDVDFFTDVDWPLSELVEALPQPGAQPASRIENDDEPDLLRLAEPPSDDELVANLVRYLRQDAQFEVTENLIRNLLYSIRVDRIAVLIGKPGTGKTEFVRAFANALGRALRTTVHLTEEAITAETAEFDMIGYRDLAGRYVPSRILDELNRGEPERDIYVLLLDEFNLAEVDVYAAKMISGITNRIPIDLPGNSDPDAPAGVKWYPQSGRWIPHGGVVIIGTMNSYLEDPSRKPLTVPVKRRSNLISMPDPLHDLVLASDPADSSIPEDFRRLCRLLLDQSVRRLRVRGTAAFDGNLLDQLMKPVAEEASRVLWELSRRLAIHDEVAMTLGLLQSILRYVQTSEFSDVTAALDLQIEQKVLPILRGDSSLLDEVEAALGTTTATSWRRTAAAIGRMRVLAENNASRIRPLA